LHDPSDRLQPTYPATVATDTIDYVATDNDGLAATNTRTGARGSFFALSAASRTPSVDNPASNVRRALSCLQCKLRMSCSIEGLQPHDD
jgi:hypothetical protein